MDDNTFRSSEFLCLKVTCDIHRKKISLTQWRWIHITGSSTLYFSSLFRLWPMLTSRPSPLQNVIEFLYSLWQIHIPIMTIIYLILSKLSHLQGIQMTFKVCQTNGILILTMLAPHMKYKVHHSCVFWDIYVFKWSFFKWSSTSTESNRAPPTTWLSSKLESHCD